MISKARKYSLSEFVVRSMVEHNSTVDSRSPQCLLLIHPGSLCLLCLVDFIDTLGRESALLLQVYDAKIICDDAHHSISRTSGDSTTAGYTLCLKLNSCGIMDNSTTATTKLGGVELYLRHWNAGNSLKFHHLQYRT